MCNHSSACFSKCPAAFLLFTGLLPSHTVSLNTGIITLVQSSSNITHLIPSSTSVTSARALVKPQSSSSPPPASRLQGVLFYIASVLGFPICHDVWSESNCHIYFSISINNAKFFQVISPYWTNFHMEITKPGSHRWNPHSKCSKVTNATPVGVTERPNYCNRRAVIISKHVFIYTVSWTFYP